MKRFFQNRKSILVLFVASFWGAYTLFSFSAFTSDVNRIFETEKKTRMQRVSYQADLGLGLLILNQPEALKANLQRALELDQIDFAILLRPNEKPFVVQRPGQVEVGESYEVTDGVIEYGDLIYQTVQNNKTTLTVGTQHDHATYLKSFYEVYFWKIVLDIFLVTAMSGLLIFGILKDIFQLSKVLSSSQRALGNIGSGLSKEAEVLIQASQSYDQLSKDLAFESKVFASSIGSAITTELRRGTPVPSTFKAALVRIDLNQFTKKYIQSDLKDVIFLMNTYFETARKIIERHQGLIYEHVGDEILFLLKNESKDLALKKVGYCLRDMFEEFENLKEVQISAKAAVSYGDLHFVKLDQGYSFSGVPLISSARLIAQATKSSRFSLILEKADFQSLDLPIQKFDSWSLTPKGFAEPIELVEVQEIATITRFHPEKHRSSVALGHFLQSLKLLIATKQYEELFLKLSSLQVLGLEAPEEMIEEAFTEVLVLIASEANEAIELLPSKLISSIVSLSKSFVRRESYKEKLHPHFEKLKRKADPRLHANILMTQSFFDLGTPVTEALKSPNNRLLADALFVLGKQSLDDRVLSEIRVMLKNPQKIFRSSAYYISAELLKFYKEKDIVFYQASPATRKLKQVLAESLSDPEVDYHKHALNFQTLTGEKL
jgi:class 3 adenylate cyclase